MLACCRGQDCGPTIGICRGTWIKNVDPKIAQVAATLRRCWHSEQQGIAEFLPRAFVVCEDEHLVFLNWSPQRAAKVVPQRGGNEFISCAGERLGLRERISRLTMLVAAVFKCAAMWC